MIDPERARVSRTPDDAHKHDAEQNFGCLSHDRPPYGSNARANRRAVFRAPVLNALLCQPVQLLQ